MPTLASLIVRLSADTRDFENKMRKSQTGLAGFSRGLSAFGANARALGGTLSTFVTAPVVGLGLMASKSAMEFESSFAGVRKTVDATDKEFAEIEKQFRALSRQIPVNVNDLNRYGEAAGQLGIEKDNIVSFTRVIADLGVTTNLTGEEGAQALARFANIIGMSQKNFDRLGATIVDLGNKGASTEQEIMAMGLRLAGAGKVIGLTEAQTLGFANALSSVGIEAEAGGSAFSKVFIELASAGGAKLEKLAKVAGMSGAAFKKAFQEDAAGATIKFVEGLGEIQKSGGDLFGTLEDLGITEVRMRDALLRAAGAGNLMRQSIDDGTKAWKENNALTEEAKKRYETFESKLQIFKNRINDVGISVGQKLLPHLTKFAGTIADLAERFGRLNPKTQESIVKWALLAAVAGPVLIALGAMASSISQLITLAGSLSTALSLLAAHPIVLLIAGIAGLTATTYQLITGKSLLKTATEQLFGVTETEADKHRRAADALLYYQDVVKASQTADINLRDAKLRVIAATEEEKRAEAALSELQTSGVATADQLKDANLRLERAHIDADRAAADLTATEAQATEKFKAAGQAAHGSAPDIGFLAEKNRKLKDQVFGVTGNIQNFIGTKDPVTTATYGMRQDIGNLSDSFETLGDKIAGTWRWLGLWLERLGQAPSGRITGGAAEPEVYGPVNPNVRPRAHGGLVPRHGIYEMAERGPEYVLNAPETKMARKHGLYIGPARSSASTVLPTTKLVFTGPIYVNVPDGKLKTFQTELQHQLSQARIAGGLA